MAKYLHFFKDRAEHDDAYDITGDEYKRPWVGTIPKLVKGAPYFITYNKNMSPSTNLLDFSYTGGTLSVQIESDFAWSAACNVDWITLSGANGTSGLSTLYVIVNENNGDARTSKITLSDNVHRPKIINVAQRMKSSSIPEKIWVDNFGDREYIADDAGFGSFEEYMDAYLEDPGHYGSNCYEYGYNTLTYNGNTYYLYRLSNVSSQGFLDYALLPMDYSYDVLYDMSMEANYNNSAHCFSFFLGYDEETAYALNDNICLTVKVENPIAPGTSPNTPPSILWIDDFQNPQSIAEGLEYQNFDDYMNDYIEDPGAFGSNRFEYTNCIMEYDGTQYYLYRETYYFERERFYGLLPMGSADYDYLYENSMEDDHSNRYEPFAYILNGDGVYEAGNEDYVLVKVEE